MNKLADQLIQARTESIALRARVKELEAAKDAEWRQFVQLTHDEQIAELERRWREAEAECEENAVEYNRMIFAWQLRAERAESDNDRLGTAGMRARDWSRAWKRSAKKLRSNYSSLAEARLNCWNELNEERAIVYELEQENAKLRRALARLTAAAGAWMTIGVSGESITATWQELEGAIAEATAALGEGAEDTSDE